MELPALFHYHKLSFSILMSGISQRKKMKNLQYKGYNHGASELIFKIPIGDYAE